tara:strand:+ start:121 stop:453 length:333 start_codon:yes stop_codon:yes gene_type:complete
MKSDSTKNLYSVEVENDEKRTLRTFIHEAVDLPDAIASVPKPANEDEVVRIYGRNYTAAITVNHVIMTCNLTGNGFYYEPYKFERGERKNYLGNTDGISLFDRKPFDLNA